ncbi:MAG: gluconokinase [Pseudomonadota bacterium]
MRQAIIIMGVCGTGKTTVGEALAERLGCPFLEGDSFHPAENVEKMRAGTPLDDDDRWPWLRGLGKAIADKVENAACVVATCSALKRAYRDCLRDQTGTNTLFVLLHGDRDLLMQRLQERTHRYMPSSLLESQLATLELPDADEMSLSLDVRESAVDLVEEIHRLIDAP